MIAGTYAEEVAADNPYQWLRFQEPSGSTAQDSSGNNRHGSLIASPSRVNGPVDRAISLNGSTQAINSNITALGSNIAAATFEVNIATTDTRQRRYWAGYTRSTPPRFAILQNDDGANQQTLHLEYRSSQKHNSTAHL